MQASYQKSTEGLPRSAHKFVPRRSVAARLETLAQHLPAQMSSDGAIGVADGKTPTTCSADTIGVRVIVECQRVIQFAIQPTLVIVWARNLLRVGDRFEQSGQRLARLRGLRPQASDLASDVIDGAGPQSR